MSYQFALLVSLILACLVQNSMSSAGPRASCQGKTTDLILKFDGISKERAIEIANRDARRRFKSISRFTIVPCEQVVFWRIIYDGGGPEYVIDKSSGRIIRVQTIPQASSKNRRVRSGGSNETITERRAIEIAKQAVKTTYGSKGVDVDDFAVCACEQAKVWRVIFDLKLQPGQSLLDLPNAGFPKYVIDKTTGEVIYRELN